MDSLVGKQLLPDSSGTLTSMRSFGDPSRERKCQQPGNQLDFFVLMASARMSPLRYPRPEANRWHGMSLSLTLMQTLTSIALQSLPNMPILHLLTFLYRLSLKLLMRGMLRPLS